MSTAEAEYEYMRQTALDALALICAAARGDNVGAATMLEAYRDPVEIQHLNSALVGHAGNILHLASEASGVSPDKILGGVFASIREMP